MQGEIRRHTCIYVCVYVCMHACMYVCVCIYVCMYACIYFIRYTEAIYSPKRTGKWTRLFIRLRLSMGLVAALGQGKPTIMVTVFW